MTEGHRCPFLGCDTNVEKRGNGVGSVAFHDAGQYTDSESKLQYLRTRYYDPNTQQFLTVDPLAGQTGQPYGYARESPVNLVDPSGLCPQSKCFDYSLALAAPLNLAYGIQKVTIGVGAVALGTAAEISVGPFGIGTLVGIPALIYGGFQTATGTLRIVRAGEQYFSLAVNPNQTTECSIPSQMKRLIYDVSPGPLQFGWRFWAGLP
jgi:RHS repeat-associated protein